MKFFRDRAAARFRGARAGIGPASSGRAPARLRGGNGTAQRRFPLHPALASEFPRLVGAALEAAMNGILITDRRGVIQWVNPAFSKITGYPLDEVVGRTPRLLKSGRQTASFYEQMWSTILAGRVWHGELYNRHKDGRIYAEEQTIAPVLGARGEITHFVGIKQDITRRKLYEEMLESRNAELVVMATTINGISSSLDVDEVLRAAVEAIRELIPGARGATVQMPEATGRLVTRAASASLGPGQASLLLEPGASVAGLAYTHRTVVNVGDVEVDDRFLRTARAAPYRSLLAVPIASTKRVLGVLSAEADAPGAFVAHHEYLLTLFAGSVAVAMEHAIEYDARVQAERELKRYSEGLELMVKQRTAELEAAQVKLLEQQRLEQEVLLAAEVQASMLPRRTPDMAGYDLAGVALAARYVSGDMYDWGPGSADQLYVGISDIAGKGMPAAMLGSTCRALLREVAARGHAPGRALSDLNRFLYGDLTDAGTFITVVMARLDRRTAAVDYASAGHTEVIWYRAHAGRCERLPTTVPPIGVLPDLPAEDRRVHLCPGDILVFYSDGVTEAEDAHGELFGTERLEDLVRAGASLPAAALARSIVQSVDAFAHGERSDDLTLVVVKALPRTVSFRIPADLAHLDEAMEVIRSVAQAYGAAFAYELELAASEIVTNVVEHAYRGAAAGELRGELRLEPERVQLDLHDDGQPFDLGNLPPKDCRQATDRGYGVHIARQLLQEVAYEPATREGNHWRLVKLRRPEGMDDGG